MKKHILTWLIKKGQLQKRQAELNTIEEAASLCIVVSLGTSESLDRFLKFARQAMVINKNVQFVVYLKHKKIQWVSEEIPAILIKPKDISFWGKLKAEITNILPAQPQAVLINIDATGSLVCHYLVHLIPANFRIGIDEKSVQQPVYDLRLRSDNQDDYVRVFEEIVNYLRSLKGK
ncbi:MAG: hypothetical protein KKD74_01265 [Bacteroidetes bacterium]|nr:hypothetical protein [Bacteroidota bacterium]